MTKEDKEKIILKHDNLIHFIQQKFTIHNFTYEELHQELLTHVAYKLDEYDKERSSLTTFIHMVVVNKLKNMYKNKRNKVVEIATDEKEMNYLLDELAPYSPSEKMALEVAFDIAREHPRSDIILRIMHGESMTNIARDSYCDISTVSKIWKSYIDKVKSEL